MFLHGLLLNTECSEKRGWEKKAYSSALLASCNWPLIINARTMSPTIQTLFAPCIPSFGVVTLSLSFLLLLLLGVSHKKRNGNEQVFLRKQEIPKKRPTSGTSDEQFVKVFPHQTRENLKLLAATLPELQRVRLGNLKFDQSVFEQSILDFVENPLDADPGKYVYSGYSVREVKALGDFPDYAILSGIPLPNPWTEFDIEKSRPRPYRPLRWPYHQTLGEYCQEDLLV